VKTKKDNIFWAVLGSHAGILILLLVIPAVKSCHRPKPKDPVVFVEIMTESSIQSTVIQPAPEPEIVTPAEPEPAPDPTPEPKPITKPAPKPKPKPKPKVEPKPEKPKWEPKPVVRQNRRITKTTSNPTPQPVARQQPNISSLKDALTGSMSQENSYFQTVFARYHSIWRQPRSVPIQTSALAEIRVEKSGRVSAAQIIRRSGNATFDNSVQTALNAVSHLSAPPASLAGTRITIDFVLD
jgi:TonB family protein